MDGRVLNIERPFAPPGIVDMDPREVDSRDNEIIRRSTAESGLYKSSPSLMPELLVILDTGATQRPGSQSKCEQANDDCQDPEVCPTTIRRAGDQSRPCRIGPAQKRIYQQQDLIVARLYIETMPAVTYLPTAVRTVATSSALGTQNQIVVPTGDRATQMVVRCRSIRRPLGRVTELGDQGTR